MANVKIGCNTFIRSGGLLQGSVSRRALLGIGLLPGLLPPRRRLRLRLATRGLRRFLRRGGLGGGDRLWCPRLALARLASLELRRRCRRRGPWFRLRRRRDF